MFREHREGQRLKQPTASDSLWVVSGRNQKGDKEGRPEAPSKEAWLLRKGLENQETKKVWLKTEVI